MLSIEVVYHAHQGFIFVTHVLVLQTKHFRRVLRTETYMEDAA